MPSRICSIVWRIDSCCWTAEIAERVVLKKNWTHFDQMTIKRVYHHHRNALCGSIQCQRGGKNPIGDLSDDSGLITYSTLIHEGGNAIECKWVQHVIFLSGSWNPPSPLHPPHTRMRWYSVFTDLFFPSFSPAYLFLGLFPLTPESFCTTSASSRMGLSAEKGWWGFEKKSISRQCSEPECFTILLPRSCADLREPDVQVYRALSEPGEVSFKQQCPGMLRTRREQIGTNQNET